MRILCLNAWGGTLHRELLDYLPDASPDVLCLQEVVHTPGAPADVLVYRDQDHVLHQRANLFSDVAAILPDHLAIFCPAAQGDLWHGEQPVISQWGLATFVRRSFPVIGQHQGFVHKGYSANDFGEHPRSRNAHGVRLWDHQRGWPVTIVHTHGLRDLAGKMDTPDRITQAQRLAGIVRTLAEPGDRTVVCGDLNVEPASATFRILGDMGLADLVTSRGFTDTRTSHYAKPGRYADYMLVNGLVAPLAFEVVTTPEVSDHRPLLLEI